MTVPARPLRRLLAGVVLAALLAACGGGDDGAPRPSAEYSAASDAWRRSGPSDYRFTLAISCFCTWQGPMTIAVRGGRVVDARYLRDGSVLDAAALRLLPTIGGLFDIVDDAYARHADRVDVTLDASGTYPAHVSLDPIQMAIDDEVDYRASDLVVSR